MPIIGKSFAGPRKAAHWRRLKQGARDVQVVHKHTRKGKGRVEGGQPHSVRPMNPGLETEVPRFEHGSRPGNRTLTGKSRETADYKRWKKSKGIK